MSVIRKVKDASLKLILDEPQLFVEFLRDFVPIEILKDIDPSDIEDMTDRLLPILTEQKDHNKTHQPQRRQGIICHNHNRT